ncbi:hypothetical protein K490DRAFT_36063 [Saccharata proteae CBS 121410]|uniref:Exosome complex protein n=1 Tax=Saccharata proteae CBS 121410 TaxID=1314787 RepID=A0A9P4M1I4_9PEZI|nr:hypothetical protein K490DRAFT_36063 [Saccharata proteae CBS 121410]
MDATDLRPLLESLELEIDDIEDALEPLLQSALPACASKLPLLDKAKLHVLVTYAIESLLFSYLRLNGTNAKEHPVFTELTRTRQYFQKISQIESAPAQRTQSLDKKAANRFIKHGLAGNERYDQERALKQARERAVAQLKLEQLNKKNKFDAAPISSEVSSNDSDTNPPEAQHAQKKRPMTASEPIESADGGQERKRARKARDGQQAEEHGRTGDVAPPRKTKSSRVPLGHGEAFKALLQGPIPETEDGDSKKRRKRSKKARE